jgi:hypothetical protein
MEKLIFWCCLGGVSVDVSSCRSLKPLGHDVVAEAGCISIFTILINTLY